MIRRQNLLKVSKKAWAARLLSLPVIIASGFLLSTAQVPQGKAQAALPQQATDNQYQKMTYEVYAGGINAVTAELDVKYETKDRYSLVLGARTKGFLGRLAPWNGTFETHGWRTEEGQIPELHKSTAVWRSEEEIKEYSYGKDGSFKGLKVTEEGEDKSPEAIEDELTQGTTDALTATLQVMEKLAETGKCEGESEVFDGKRRFKLIFKHKENVQLAKTEYNVYEGEAAVCTVEVEPIAGKWHSKPRGWMSIQEQGRQADSLPTVWMAQMTDDGPAVPVKIRVKTEYGAMFMHLINYQNQDKVLVADIVDDN